MIVTHDVTKESELSKGLQAYAWSFLLVLIQYIFIEYQ